MTAVAKAVRLFVSTLLSLALLYCGAAMVMALVQNRNLPAFPFSWVIWLNRPNVPPLVDHVANFLLISTMATLFRDMWRRSTINGRARSEHV